MLTTVSPNKDGFRDRAVIHFALTEPADVTIGIYSTRQLLLRKYWGSTAILGRVTQGDLAATAIDTGAELRRAALGGRPRPFGAVRRRNLVGAGGLPGPVVRVQGVGAHVGNGATSRAPSARLVVSTDAPAITVEVFRAGWGPRRTYSAKEMSGAA